MYEADQNKLTLEVISLMKLMMQFGFYMSTSEINDNMKPLMRLIASVNDVKDVEEEQ